MPGRTARHEEKLADSEERYPQKLKESITRWDKKKLEAKQRYGPKGTVRNDPKMVKFLEGQAEDVKAYLTQQNKEVLESGFFEIAQVFQTRVKVCASIGEVVLYEDILNSNIYPIVPLPNIWTGTPYPKSDISRARPMQKLLNKLWSLALSHAQASAGLKLLVPLFGSSYLLCERIISFTCESSQIEKTILVGEITSTYTKYQMSCL